MSSEILKDPFDESTVFKSSLKLSLGAHIFVLLFFTVKALIMPDAALDYSSAIRVDIVALPEKLDPNQIELVKPEQKAEKPQAQPQPKEVVLPKKEPDAISLKKSKSKQEEALDRLKKMSAIDRIKNEVESSQKKANALEKVSQVKGNILAAGTSLTGLNKLQHDQYISDLDAKIKRNWTKPRWIEKELKARVRIKIDQNGTLISKVLEISSGEPAYDDLVLETIDRSAPFPPPPEKFINIAAVRGILIGFPD